MRAELKDRHVTVFVTHVNMSVRDQRAAPALREHVIGKVDFGLTVVSAGVQAVEQTGEVGDVDHIVLDRTGANRPVHFLFKIDLAVRVGIAEGIVPNDRGVRVVDRDLSLLGLDGLNPLVRDRHTSIAFDSHRELR